MPLLEQREIDFMQDYIENNEGNAPEILPTERVRVLIPHDPELARYNAGVIPGENGDLLIFVRVVPRAGVRANTPDEGNVDIYRSTPEKVEKIGQLKLFHPDVRNWEDARAFRSDETDDQGVKNDEVLIGLTAIRASDNQPVAAMVRGKVSDGNFILDKESLVVYP